MYLGTVPSTCHTPPNEVLCPQLQMRRPRPRGDTFKRRQEFLEAATEFLNNVKFLFHM